MFDFLNKNKNQDSGTQKGAGTYVRDYFIIMGIICLLVACLAVFLGKQVYKPKPEPEPERTTGIIDPADADYDNLYADDGEYYNPDANNFGLNNDLQNELERERELKREQKIDTDVGGSGWTEPTTVPVEFADPVLRMFRTASVQLFNQLYANNNFAFSPYPVLSYLSTVTSMSSGSTASAIGTWLVNGSETLTENGYFSDMDIVFSSFQAKLKAQHEFRYYSGLWTNKTMLSQARFGFVNNGINYTNDTGHEGDFSIRDMNSYIQTVESKLTLTGDYLDSIMFFSGGIFEVSWPEDAEFYYDGRSFRGTDGPAQAYFFNAPSGTSVYETESATIAVSPFNYDHYQFVAILPSGNFSDYVTGFDYEAFMSVLRGMAANESSLQAVYPKFTISREYDMSEFLKAGGLVTPFTPSKDYSYMTVEDFNLGTMVHKSYFSLNGRGARSWDTVMELRDAAGAGADTIWFDRPFMWIVMDKTTQVPVMMGCIVTTADS